MSGTVTAIEPDAALLPFPRAGEDWGEDSFGAAAAPEDRSGPLSGFAAFSAFAGFSGFSGFAGFSAGAAPSLSSRQIRVPLETLSPTFTLSPRTTPASGDGTSIVDLSDSSTMSAWSLTTVSPSATS